MPNWKLESFRIYIHGTTQTECANACGKESKQSLMIVDMNVQDSSESTFASVFFEVFTQLCIRHQSELTKLEKQFPIQQK